MLQTRIFFRANGSITAQAFQLLELSLEEDGTPVAVWEVDEDNDIHEVSVYASNDVEVLRDRIAAILLQLPEKVKLETEEVPDIDWVTYSLQGLHAVRAGPFFVHGSHESDALKSGEIPILIDAGQAFGTGHHGTTAGCLEMIADIVEREEPKNVLDLGTGSAVLAIAVAKLRQVKILATDNDPVATEVAQENLKLNQVDQWVDAHTASGFDDPIFDKRAPFDLIIANILARPLMDLAPDMAAHLKDGSSIILSGILDSQEHAVIAAYTKQGLKHQTTLHREGWVTIHLKN